MEPIVEILTKNILSDNNYTRKVKEDYLLLMHRLVNSKTNIIQLYKSMDYPLLFNVLHEEILFFNERKTYFLNILDKEIGPILSDLIETQLLVYHKYLTKL
jgi:hypothetical protein